MIVNVDYIDQLGVRTQRQERVSYLAFLKHFVLAGQGNMPRLGIMKEMVGAHFFYRRYFREYGADVGRFIRPSLQRYDPNSQSGFSTLVGKAFADLLAKRLSGARVTVGYEAAMLMGNNKITGERPDLYCFSRSSQFAVEAKGFVQASVSDAEMQIHKHQAGTGPLPVKFCVASVAYDLYRSPKVKYHDPVNDNVEYPSRLIHDLCRQYYGAWRGAMNSQRIRISEVRIFERTYILLALDPGFASDADRFAPSFILDTEVPRWAEEGTMPETQRFIDSDDVFLDADGIGLIYNFNG